MSTKKFIWFFVKWLSLICLIYTLIHCKSKPILAEQHNSIPRVNGFDAFYTIFHTDSLYQLQHIPFLIEGMPEQNDTSIYKDGFKWQYNQWTIHRTFNANDSLFRREFTMLDSTLIIETIFHQVSPMRMERRFSYDDGWQLIYYSPMRIPLRVEIN